MNLTSIVTDVCTAFSFCFIFWVVFMSITRHMTARSHNAMQEKVFDKLNATPALSELVSSGALAPFLQSLAPEKPTPAAPLPRILRGFGSGSFSSSSDLR